jgi:hypothetical protein
VKSVVYFPEMRLISRDSVVQAKILEIEGEANTSRMTSPVIMKKAKKATHVKTVNNYNTK